MAYSKSCKKTKQVRLLKWVYVINANENVLKMKIGSHRYDINRPGLSTMLVISINMEQFHGTFKAQFMKK